MKDATSQQLASLHAGAISSVPIYDYLNYVEPPHWGRSGVVG